MFTGLVETQAEVLSLQAFNSCYRLELENVYQNLNQGESIAVSGVCLTLVDSNDFSLSFDLSQETLKCTNLGFLKKGDKVHLERALAVGSRIGGHWVLGHVDGMARLLERKWHDSCLELIIGEFTLDPSLYLIPKGSIALDGVSLTINRVDLGTVSLLLVPHTLKATSLEKKTQGSWFNVEFDYLCRIVAEQLRTILPNLSWNHHET